MEVLNEVLNILFEFGGGKGGEPNNVVVRFLLPAFFWTVLAGIAVKEWCRTRERKDFYVGAASLMGIARELLMFTAEYGSLRGYIPFEFLYKYYPPLEHAWTMLSCIFIGYAFLNYLSKWRHFPAMFLMITSTVTVILYSVIASLWPFFLEYNPGASFGTFWGDLVFRISASLFMGIVLGAFIFARSRGRYVPQPLLWGFLFLFLDEFLMIFNIISGERYVHIYAPVRHNLHIWAIPLFLGVYWADTIRRMASAEHAIRRTFELSPSMLCIIGYDGIIRVASPASKQILGLAPEELQGLSVTELGFDSRDHGLSPLTPDAWSEEQSAFEREIIREDGTARWLHWKIQPAGKEKMLYAVVSDITENKLAKDRLEAVYKTTRDIINNAPFGIYVVNETGRVEYVNPVMLQIAGYSHEQFVKLNVFTLPFYISIGLTEKIKKGLRGERFRMDSVEFSSYFQRDKAVLNFTGIPLDEGNGKKVLMIVEDITERAKLEAQLVQAQKMEVIGQLAGGIAHDFNNILTGIIGTGALMKARMGRHNLFEQSLDQIIGLANRAGKLTQGLLTFSRKRTTKLQPVDINDIIGNLQKILARLIREDIDLEVELCPGKLPVMADAGQIEQVLMNLATNARDAMPHGGKLIIGTGLAGPGDGLMKSGDHGETGEYALVSVQDTGVGMDKHIMEHLFEPFFTTKGIGKGTGLGLATVYGIIKQHNARIDVESEPGKGTTFRIYMPLDHTEMACEIQPESPPPAAGSETILVAEDDDVVRDIVKCTLEEFGYRVIEAIDGESAVRAFSERKNEIQLALFDVIMPKRNGKEAYEEIKTLNPALKVLFMSGYPGDIVNQKGLIEERDNFIEKPVGPNELLIKVREVLDGPGVLNS